MGRFLPVSEVARILHFDPRTIRGMVRRGDLTGGVYEGRYRVTEESVSAYIRRGATSPTDAVHAKGDLR